MSDVDYFYFVLMHGDVEMVFPRRDENMMAAADAIEVVTEEFCNSFDIVESRYSMRVPQMLDGCFNGSHCSVKNKQFLFGKQQPKRSGCFGFLCCFSYIESIQSLSPT